MKFAIIGCQGHFSAATRAAQDDSSLVLCGIAPGLPGEDMGKTVQFAKDAGLNAPYYDDWKEMVLKEKPEVCVVNTVFYATAPICAELLRQGIHVYGEKPSGTTLEQLEDLEAAYAQGKAEYLAMLTFYYEPPFNKAFRMIQQGTIGQVRLITGQKSYRLGKRAPFYADFEQYGGTIPWVGVHAATWAYQMSGNAAFRSAYALSNNEHNRGNGTLDMAAVMQFEMAGGILFNSNIDFLRPSCAPSHADDRVRVAGTEGVIEVRGEQVHVISPDFTGIAPHDDIPAANIFADFVGAIGGTPARFNAMDSFAISRAVLCAQKSAQTGQIIQMD